MFNKSFIRIVCKQPVVNGWQELGRSFHKQKIEENGMAMQ